jgi:hypothetical protein
LLGDLLKVEKVCLKQLLIARGEIIIGLGGGTIMQFFVV